MRNIVTLVQMTDIAERDLLQELRRLTARFRKGRDPEAVLRQGLRLSMDFFQASSGCIAVLPSNDDLAEIQFTLPRVDDWNLAMLAAFIKGEPTETVPHQMFSRIRRRERKWGVISIACDGADFRWEARRAFSLVGETVSEIIDRMDLERLREVRSRIDHKIMEQVRPKDLVYQILHGLRSLTDYDHSASLLMCNDANDSIEVAAEQIAWRKGKSKHVGLKLPMPHDVRALLQEDTVYCFQREELQWLERDGRSAVAIADLLDYNLHNCTDVKESPEHSMLCAPLLMRDRLLGVIKVASLHRDALGPYEVDLVSRFLPQVSIAIQNTQRTESLEESILIAERKHAMADLARGVSHDVNNAVGSLLPLIQQMLHDANDGECDPAVLVEDLQQIETSVQVCRRIFGGMLRFARGAAQNAGDVYLEQEIECALSLLQDSLVRNRITTNVNLPEQFAPIRGVQSEVEQLLLNILGNARDAMPHGGSITIAGSCSNDLVTLEITDSGCGIPKRLLTQILEPFFTTKTSGNGLGLSICRSILSQMNGKMEIMSTPGIGTKVTLLLPTIEETVHATSR